MNKTVESTRLLSHTVSPDALENVIAKITSRIQQQGDKAYVSVETQLNLLQQLSQFDFGRYLLLHQGFNGFWTHYMLTHPWFGKITGKNNRGESFSQLESFLLNTAPSVLATQRRFQIFLKENQKAVKNHAKLASIPSGMMGELLYLNYKDIKEINLIGIDYDPDSAQDAESLAKEKKLTHFVKLFQRDAWHLNFENEFDLISSNGLNIYESDDNKVTELYRQFYKALKPGGKLVTSFLTLPPGVSTECEWDMKVINQNDLLLQKIIFIDILEGKWTCYRSSKTTHIQLTSAGFNQIEFISDGANQFPTVVAWK